LLLAQQTLNNDAVVKMVKMGFGEDLIVNAINHSPGAYDTSMDGLIERGRREQGGLSNGTQGYGTGSAARYADDSRVGGLVFQNSSEQPTRRFRISQSCQTSCKFSRRNYSCRTR
jgi:hypothetical protein